ncbi:MAG: HEAT repeat domain-containing protein, partial [Acidobacteria bacterium]|nr:HEAT repeat domain-containing protein [Acidobacteriota bacterium]
MSVQALLLPLLVLLLADSPRQAARDTVPARDVQAAIEKLGSLEFETRMEASRTVRRASADVAAPLLHRAVAGHADGYVRYRALVLLSGFNDPRTRETMASVLDDKNDRLRAVAYAYFEHHPDPQILPRLLGALEKEESEFVRPALTRALAAYGSDPRVRSTMTALALRGQNFFRSVVIEALGDHKAGYALPTLTEIAKLEGPLQYDAVLAMGKIGDKKALETFVALQRGAPRSVQPAVAAAICLVGVNCASHQGYLASTLTFAIQNPGYQDLLRAAASALAAVALEGGEDAATELIVQGGPTRDPERAAIALALGTVALRNATMILRLVENERLAGPAIELLHEAFDMLDEDFEEERFFVAVRRAYWQASENSPTRRAAEALIRR